MADFAIINIYNEGKLPWLGITGPVFGYKISIGVLQLIAKDSRFNYTICNSQEDIDKAKAAYEEAKGLKSHKIVINEVPPVDTTKEVITEVPPVEEPKETVHVEVEDTLTPEEIVESVEAAEGELPTEEALDDEIDSILEEDPIDPYAEVPVTKKEETDTMVIYTKEELMGMTKKDLKEILESRGYYGFKGRGLPGDDYGAKYHDTVETLVEKVLATQKTK